MVKQMCCGQEGQFYFAKTSGTTSGEKHIPISKESMPYHIKGSIDATMHYINETSNTGFLNKKVIFLQGSPELEEKNSIKTGRLSWDSSALYTFFFKKQHNAILGSELY